MCLALHAVHQANVKCADVLLNYRANSTRIEPSSGLSALTLAASKGNEHMVRLFLQYGGNPDAPDSTGTSARLVATKKPVKALIQEWDDGGAAAFEVSTARAGLLPRSHLAESDH
jgi:ankyrin repeat protein